jgi:hypothetical protein
LCGASTLLRGSETGRAPCDAAGTPARVPGASSTTSIDSDWSGMGSFPPDERGVLDGADADSPLEGAVGATIDDAVAADGASVGGAGAVTAADGDACRTGGGPATGGAGWAGADGGADDTGAGRDGEGTCEAEGAGRGGAGATAGPDSGRDAGGAAIGLGCGDDGGDDCGGAAVAGADGAVTGAATGAEAADVEGSGRAGSRPSGST